MKPRTRLLGAVTGKIGKFQSEMRNDLGVSVWVEVDTHSFEWRGVHLIATHSETGTRSTTHATRQHGRDGGQLIFLCLNRCRLERDRTSKTRKGTLLRSDQPIVRPGIDGEVWSSIEQDQVPFCILNWARTISGHRDNLANLNSCESAINFERAHTEQETIRSIVRETREQPDGYPPFQSISDSPPRLPFSPSQTVSQLREVCCLSLGISSASSLLPPSAQEVGHTQNIDSPSRGVSEWFFSGVIVVSQWCPSGVPVAQWCPSGVPVVFQWSWNCANGVLSAPIAYLFSSPSKKNKTATLCHCVILC